MSIDTETSKEYEKTWNEKTRFKGISQERLDKIEKEEKETKEAQELIDEQVKKTVQENPGQVFDKEAAEKVEAEKAKKLKSIYK